MLDVVTSKTILKPIVHSVRDLAVKVFKPSKFMLWSNMLLHVQLQAQHGTMFQPALPDSTVSAINNLGFGIVDKIFVDFGSAVESASASPHDFSHQGLAGGSNGDQSKAIPQSSTGHTDSHSRNAEQAEPLGQKEVVSYSLLWKRDQQEFAPKQVQQSDAAHHKQSAGQATGNSQAGQGQDQTGSKGAGDKTPESHVVVSTTDSSLPSSSSLRDDHTAAKLPSWAHGVYTLRFAGSEFVHGKQSNAVAASNRCGVMWITGDFAQSMESTSDPELQTGIAAILQRFPALQLPCTFRAYRSSWGSDPLFRGSYSYGSATATGQECQVLSKPVCPLGTSMPTLLLAGEACHPQYFGCTHGAYLTGQSQAQVLLKSYFPISVHGAAS